MLISAKRFVRNVIFGMIPACLMAQSGQMTAVPDSAGYFLLTHSILSDHQELLQARAKDAQSAVDLQKRVLGNYGTTSAEFATLVTHAQKAIQSLGALADEARVLEASAAKAGQTGLSPQVLKNLNDKRTAIFQSFFVSATSIVSPAASARLAAIKEELRRNTVSRRLHAN